MWVNIRISSRQTLANKTRVSLVDDDVIVVAAIVAAVDIGESFLNFRMFADDDDDV